MPGFKKVRLVSTSMVVVFCLMSTMALLACSVPVFRYALEKWENDAYQVVVFHRGALKPEMQSMLNTLPTEETRSDKRTANLYLTTVDLDDSPSEKMQALWATQQEQARDSLPWMTIVNSNPQPGIVWGGQPSEEAISRLINSPVRREVVKKLLEGDTAVWILLDGLDESENERVHRLLSKKLVELQSKLKLPEIEEADIAQGLISGDPNALKVSFPLLRLSRDDPAEKMFIEMLLTTESDLRDPEYIDKTMAFPVFGRGRALYALIGKGINNDTITETCNTLIGPCTCQVKDQNPGADLVTAINWDKSVETMIQVDTTPSPLPEIVSMINTAKSENSPTDKQSTDASSLPAVDSASSGSLISSTFIFMGICMVLVVGLSLFLVGSKT